MSADQETDYKDLLIKYMAIVLDAEGISFVRSDAFSILKLTDIELSELNDIEKSAHELINKTYQ